MDDVQKNTPTGAMFINGLELKYFSDSKMLNTEYFRLPIILGQTKEEKNQNKKEPLKVLDNLLLNNLLLVDGNK